VIKPTDLAPRPLVEWNRGTNDNASVGVHLWTSGPTNEGGPGSLFVNLRDTARSNHIVFTSAGLLTANEFQNIALTYDRPLGLVTIYRNGIRVIEANVGTISLDTSSDLYLGHRLGTTNVFTGQMDEITIYNRALGSNEIAGIYAAGAAGKCTEPEGTPYVYVNGVNYTDDTITLISDAPVEVSMLSTFLGGSIRYSLDGSPPTNGDLYLGPFAISNSVSLQAIAFNSGGVPSPSRAVALNLLRSSELTPNRLRVVSLQAGQVSLAMRGIPGRKHKLQRSSDLVSWTEIVAMDGPIDGVLLFKDSAPPLTTAFYRVLTE
jgi:hypothetical protein